MSTEAVGTEAAVRECSRCIGGEWVDAAMAGPSTMSILRWITVSKWHRFPF
jgi:hypothetical protein